MASLIDLLEKAAEKYGNKTAVKSIIDESEYTYEEIKNISQKIAGILIELGIKEGDTAAIITENNPDFITADYGILYSGAASVPIDESLSGELMENYFLDCNPKIILVQDKFHDKVRSAASKDVKIISMENLLKNINLNTDNMKLPNIKDDDIAAIIYSSGSTANADMPSKGIMLSHNNIGSNILMCDELMPSIDNEVYLGGVALHWHSFEYTLQKTMLYRGSLLHYTNLTGFRKNNHGAKINPTHMIMIPRMANLVMKEIYRNLEKKFKDMPNEKEIFQFIVKKIESSKNHVYKTVNDGNSGFLSDISHKVLDIILYSKIRKQLSQKLGNRIEYLIGGSAPLDIETQKFFYAVGMPIYHGYGLTETSPVVCVNLPDEYKFGSSGKIPEDIKIKIIDHETFEDITDKMRSGLICVRGPNVFQGYLNNTQKTEEVLSHDGWFNTEDIGFLDKDRYLYITGREKGLIVLDNGEKVGTETYESFFENSGDISRLIIVGEGRPNLGAIVVPSKNIIDDINEGRLTETAAKEMIEKQYSQHRKRFKIGITHFTLDLNFDEKRYITPKQSLRRASYLEDNMHIINRMYP